MILQANSVGGVTDDETGPMYEIARLAAVIEVTTDLHPYTPQPLLSIHPFGPTIIRKFDPPANPSFQPQKAGFPILIHPQSLVGPEWTPATTSRLFGLVANICGAWEECPISVNPNPT